MSDDNDDDPFAEFEAAIERQFGDELRKPDGMGAELWSALANVDWYHPEKHLAVSYSFRAAGGMIAEIIGAGCYMDWYCSGPYAEVSSRVAHAMRKEGWIYDDIGSICDEPGCIKTVSCCGEGRATCSEHSPWLKRILPRRGNGT